ncbi:hypothetical protein Trydic_g9717 [Trypoxylus dichotomus]
MKFSPKEGSSSRNIHETKIPVYGKDNQDDLKYGRPLEVRTQEIINKVEHVVLTDLRVAREIRILETSALKFYTKICSVPNQNYADDKFMRKILLHYHKMEPYSIEL